MTIICTSYCIHLLVHAHNYIRLLVFVHVYNYPFACMGPWEPSVWKAASVKAIPETRLTSTMSQCVGSYWYFLHLCFTICFWTRYSLCVKKSWTFKRTVVFLMQRHWQRCSHKQLEFAMALHLLNIILPKQTLWHQCGQETSSIWMVKMEPGHESLDEFPKTSSQLQWLLHSQHHDGDPLTSIFNCHFLF